MFIQTALHPHFKDEDLNKLPEYMSLNFVALENIAHPMTERVYEARITVTSPVGRPCIFRVEIEFLYPVEGEKISPESAEGSPPEDEVLGSGYDPEAEYALRKLLGLKYPTD